MYDDLRDELREVLDQRNGEIEALANELGTEEELQAFIVAIDAKLQALIDDLEREREILSYREE
ncbi:MAG: hypothetical protein Q8O92_03485 [Candidatus Latescibacter sp.]|nr:hypothetical protein [Candidatus Latescibacter sp.]